jgi:hypothetical protein
MVMAWASTPAIKMGQTFTADCPLPTADYFHDKMSAMFWCRNKNGMAEKNVQRHPLRHAFARLGGFGAMAC